MPPLAIGRTPVTSVVKATVVVDHVPAVTRTRPVQADESWPVPPKAAPITEPFHVPAFIVDKDAPPNTVKLVTVEVVTVVLLNVKFPFASDFGM